MKNRIYIAIDLKSFYASVECVERELDPLTTLLVVADEERSIHSVCLAISPPLKKLGISGRPRLFQVKKDIGQLNTKRKGQTSSHFEEDLIQRPDWKIDFIVARPQMARYIEVSSQIYSVYLNWIAPEDIHVYSIDEVFIDATDYLSLYQMSGREFAEALMKSVYQETGIPSASGVGTNMYLAKIAMDILAKHQPSNQQGLRVADLDELSYRKLLWRYQPLTDFWQIGPGISRRLEKLGLLTMQDIAAFSLNQSYDLYKEFGINAELLIDHAWGYESCTMADIKNYRPSAHSLSNGQALYHNYPKDEARVIVREMADQLALDLVAKGLVTDHITLSVRYKRPGRFDEGTTELPRRDKGSQSLPHYTASSQLIGDTFIQIFDKVANPERLIRKISLSAHHTIPKNQAAYYYQTDLFSETDIQELESRYAKEYSRQQAVLKVKARYGKNALLKGMSLLDYATGQERNEQIGGHRA